LTARGSRRDISAGRLMGADDYLVKPFEPEEFLIAVQNKLQRAADMRAQVAESLNDVRRNLVQLLSHELHTPLTYVTGGFALLAEELEGQRSPVLNDDIRASLRLIQSGTQRLNRLAEQTVLYSEIMSGYVSQQVREAGETLDLEFVLDDALSLLDEYAHERGVTFWRTAPKESVLVYGVKDLLVTAISEVIRNAIQYSTESTQAELSVTREETFGVCVVTDHGRGIPLEDQATIWDVFVQAGRERTEQQGVGMGLPIVKGIITSHGGHVALRSTPGEETQVTLRIPLDPTAI
jgi:two-component system sensor histidine kinase SenX3